MVRDDDGAGEDRDAVGDEDKVDGLEGEDVDDVPGTGVNLGARSQFLSNVSKRRKRGRALT